MEQSVYSSKQVICFFSFSGWNKVVIEKLSCLFDNESNTLLTFTTQFYAETQRQEYSFLSAIPQEWKTKLKQQCFLSLTEYVTFSIEKLTCKTICNTSLNHQHFPPPTAELNEDSLNMALTSKEDKKYTHFLFVLQMK